MVYPALLPLMRTPRLPVVDWTDAPRRFKWTRPFRQKTTSGFYACAITFQLASTSVQSYQIQQPRDIHGIFLLKKIHIHISKCITKRFEVLRIQKRSRTPDLIQAIGSYSPTSEVRTNGAKGLTVFRGTIMRKFAKICKLLKWWSRSDGF